LIWDLHEISIFQFSGIRSDTQFYNSHQDTGPLRARIERIAEDARIANDKVKSEVQVRVSHIFGFPTHALTIADVRHRRFYTSGKLTRLGNKNKSAKIIEAVLEKKLECSPICQTLVKTNLPPKRFLWTEFHLILKLRNLEIGERSSFSIIENKYFLQKIGFLLELLKTLIV